MRWMLLLCLSLLASQVACEPPEPLKDALLVTSVWNDGKSGAVGFGAAAKKLTGDAFPLQVTVGPMGADSGLPKAGDPGAKSYNITQEALDQSLSIAGLPPEAGVVLRDAQGQVLDQVLYVAMPTDAVLVRDATQERFCQRAPWQQDGSCTQTERKGYNRLRQIRSEAEFAKLAKASGQQGLQIKEVKVLVDLQRDAVTHYVDSNEFDLHYTWVRRAIEGKKALDRCKDDERSEFNAGWVDFSNKNYFHTDSRRWLLATIIYYEGQKKYALEFAAGDRIKYHQLVTTYRSLRATFPRALELPVRPLTQEQHDELFHTNAEEIPLMPIDEPYRGQNTQLLSPGVAYGVLTPLAKAEVAAHPLGLRIIAVLKDVPNDINFVGGIISTHFQSSLSHINVLSRNRGTPHLVIKDAVESIKSLFGKLVRLEVTQDGYTLKEASQQEATAFWEKQVGVHKPWTPQGDVTKKALIDLKDATYKDSVLIGAKAANMAEMAKVSIKLAWHNSCRQFDSHGLVPLPAKPFGIPFYWYVDHITRAGYKDKIEAWHNDKKFLEDPLYRRERLQELRDAIAKTEVNPELMALLHKEVKARYGDIKVRFRSSTNVEDLPNFNGAGLYTSKSAQLGHETKTIEQALRTVWASLWAERAWSERQFYKIDHTAAAMGVLVHPSFPNEAANGVAISGNIFNPSSATDTYVAVQKGELSVVNPETNDTPDQFLMRWFQQVETIFLSYSTRGAGKPLMTSQERLLLGCYMHAIHSHFRPIFQDGDKPFAMDVEFKIDKSPRKLFIKQARPYIFGEHQTSSQCKEP